MPNDDRLEEKIADMDDDDFGGVEEKVGLWGREIKGDDMGTKDEEEVKDLVGMPAKVAPGWDAVFAAAGLRSAVE